MNQTREDINCDIVCSMGVMGKGVGVAILDTGAYLHEDSRDRVAAFAGYVSQRPQPYDDDEHGTHISAMIGGSGASSEEKYGGMAPGCNLMSVKVPNHKGNGCASDVLTGSKWIRKHMQEYDIHIVDTSVGSLSRRDMTGNSILVRGADAAWGDGLVVVVAAGNHGPGRMTITTPGISRRVIAMGCSDDHKKAKVVRSRMMDYFGHGPTLVCTYKSGIVAPRSGIVSCCNEPGRHFSKSGASMSTSSVSGAITLLLEKYPGMSNKDVKSRIHERAANPGLPHNQQG